MVICPGRLALCCYAKYGFSRRLNAPHVGGQLSVQKQERQQFEVKGKEVVGSCTLAFSSLRKESGETEAQENAAPPL